MKCSVVLLSFLITVVYSHPHPNSSGFPAIFWGGEQITESNFNVSDWWSTPNKVLECRTDLPNCCSDEQGFHRGDWYFPNGTRVQLKEEAKGHVYQSRGDRVVSLHRRGDNVELGKYFCKVETLAEHRRSAEETLIGQRVCIDITNATDVPTCSGGKVWTECGSACPWTCDDHDTFCTLQCVAKCVCPDGMVEHGDRCIPISECPSCADKLVVQAFTSGIAFGHSNGHHSLFISLKNGKNATIDFYNREGDDMAAHKGDIWALDLSKTELPCFDFRDVHKIALVANSNDGWHIESVTTMLGVNGWHGTRWALLTVDMDANFWIDANAGEDRKWRYLTRVWWHPQRG